MKGKGVPMLRRLFIVLQGIFSIPIIFFWFVWLTEYNNFFIYNSFILLLVFSQIIYVITVLVKWIVYGKIHLYKIGEGNVKIHYNKNKPKKPPIVPNGEQFFLTEQERNEMNEIGIKK